jgi:hypothetical protein
MRLVVYTLAIVMLSAACEQQASPAARPSPSPAMFGTATLSETACTIDMPSQLPMGVVHFALVNQTKYSGRFILGNIHQGHTFQELVDYWNGPEGQVQQPSFASEVESMDVSAGKSDEMAATVSVPGVYAFHCGYVSPDTGKAVAFWHELKAG